MSVVPLRRTNDLRSYVQGLANRVREREVDGVLVIECKRGVPIRQHASGVHTSALAGATMGITLDVLVESALGPFERRGLSVARTLDFLRDTFRWRELPQSDLDRIPPSTPHEALHDVLVATTLGEDAPRLDREQYENLNRALWSQPVLAIGDSLAMSIDPAQWIQLTLADRDGARALAEALQAGEAESWVALFPDSGPSALDGLDDCWCVEQRRLLDRLEEVARETIDEVAG